MEEEGYEVMLKLVLHRALEIGEKWGTENSCLQRFSSYTAPAYSQLRKWRILSLRDTEEEISNFNQYCPRQLDDFLKYLWKGFFVVVAASFTTWILAW